MRRIYLTTLFLASLVLIAVQNGKAQISGDSLIWKTSLKGYDTIASPSLNVYYLGNISYTDHFTFLSLKITGPVDTSRILQDLMQIHLDI